MTAPQSRPLARYAAWLDGETLLLRRGDSHQGMLTHQIHVDRALKTNALLANRIVITDVQLIDSPGLALAFADSDFRKVLALDRDWLELRTRPDRADEAAAITPDGKRARSGLHRSQNPHWISSCFPKKTRATKEFHSFLLDITATAFNAGWLEEAAVKDGFLRSAPKRTTLELEEQVRLGIIHGLAHFGTGSGRSATPGEVVGSQDYHQVLNRLSNETLDDEDAVVVERTLKIIANRIDSDNRPKRSALKPVLKAEPLEPYEKRRVWRTAVVAWNRALAGSIGADGAHYPHLRDAVRVPLYLPTDEVTDLSSDSDRFLRDPESVREKLMDLAVDVPYDFSFLPWSRIVQIIANERIAKLRREYTAALASPLIVDDTRPFSSLVAALADDISRHDDPLPEGKGFWLAATLAASRFKVGPAIDITRKAYATMRVIARLVTKERVISTLHRFEG